MTTRRSTSIFMNSSTRAFVIPGITPISYQFPAFSYQPQFQQFSIRPTPIVSTPIMTILDSHNSDYMEQPCVLGKKPKSDSRNHGLCCKKRCFPVKLFVAFPDHETMHSQFVHFHHFQIAALMSLLITSAHRMLEVIGYFFALSRSLDTNV